MLAKLKTSVATAGLLMLLTGPNACAEEENHATSVGDLKVVHAWTRASAAGDDTLVFMEIENTGATDRLTGGRSAIAGGVAIVGLTIAGDTVSTATVGPVDVPRGELELDPGGLALELRELTTSLADGDEVEITLTFERAGDVPIHVEVEAADARQHGHAGHRH